MLQALRTRPAPRAPTLKDFSWNREGMPYCCGLAVLGGFGISDGVDWNSPLTTEFLQQVRNRFEDNISETCYEDNDSDDRDSVVAGYLASTTRSQGIVNTILEKTGWTKISTNTNPNTGNTLYTWMFNIG